MSLAAESLKLQRSVEAYRILRRPNPPPPLVVSQHLTDDKPHFAFTKTALETLGFTSEEILDILKLVGVVLKLCNIEFVPATNIDGTVGCAVQQEYEMAECASLLGCGANLLSSALQAEWCAAEAAAHRDILARSLYSRLFTWLLYKINSVIKVKDYSKRGTLSVLDMYGFETLAVNSLEQLLINYSNELLHHVVIRASLHCLQEEYVQEGLDWQKIPFFDNEPICTLIDEERHGLLTLLEEPHVADGGAAQLLTRLHHCWAGHSHLLIQPPTHFQLRHYAGAVTYDATHFVEKNSDQLGKPLTFLLYRCSHPLLKELFPEGNPDRQGSRRPSPMGTSQRVALKALATALSSRTLHHIHCLRPNDQQRPRLFHTSLVQHQVRYSGLMETVLLWRSGHCASIPFPTLISRFSPLLPRGALVLPPVQACRTLLRSLPIPQAEFAFGRTKLFIRSPRTVFELEEMRNMRLEELAVVIQKWWRGWRARRELRARGAAQRVIAASWRRWKTRKRIMSMQQEKRIIWAVLTIQKHYIQWKRRRYLLTLMSSLSLGHMSPLCTFWPCEQPRLHHTHILLHRIHHIWRCQVYRMKFDQTARNRMREKVTASIIFKDRKQNYSRSVSHPFVGDYVRLRQNAVWKRVCIDTDDQYVVFADIINKVTRSTGKMVPTLAVISTSAMLVLDQRTLGVKYRIPATEIYRISLSPLSDHICVFHVRASDISKKKGDFVFETCHMIEMVTKLFLVVQNAVGKAPEVNISTEFDANFGQQTVTFCFKCFSHQAGDSGGVRVVRKGSKMEILV